MSRLRQSDDGWDIAGSVGASAVMVAAGRAAETGPGGDKQTMTAWGTTPGIGSCTTVSSSEKQPLMAIRRRAGPPRGIVLRADSQDRIAGTARPAAASMTPILQRGCQSHRSRGARRSARRSSARHPLTARGYPRMVVIHLAENGSCCSDGSRLRERLCYDGDG